MTKTNHVITALVALAAVSLLVLAFGNATTRVQGAVYDATNITVATSSAAVAVTSSQVILATTTNALSNGTSYTRVYATICNPSATVVYVNMDNGKAAALSGGAFTVAIAAAAGYNACYEITDRNQYSGTITASSTNQTAVTVYAKQYVQ